MTSLSPKTSHIGCAGDWHGNISWASYCLRQAKEAQIGTIIQVGDFGYWEHEPEGKYYLDKLSENAVLRGVNVIWLDGNHENHPLLWELYADAEKSDEGFWKIRENVWYSPRGNAWTWRDKKFMTVGGAHSIDREFRKAGTSWWPTEILSPQEVRTAQAVGKVDYLFTHDAPTCLPITWLKPSPESEISRRDMSDIAKVVKPKVWFHGHYHKFIKYGYDFFNGPPTYVVGLECDTMAYNMVEFDIDQGWMGPPLTVG